MANVFKKAKQLYKKNPRKYKTWQSAVKAASKQPKKKSTRKKVRPVTRKRSTKPARSKRSASGNPAYHKRIAKKQYESKLGTLLVKQFKAAKKATKKKLGKQIRTVKASIKKLSD